MAVVAPSLIAAKGPSKKIRPSVTRAPVNNALGAIGFVPAALQGKRRVVCNQRYIY